MQKKRAVASQRAVPAALPPPPGLSSCWAPAASLGVGARRGDNAGGIARVLRRHKRNQATEARG